MWKMVVRVLAGADKEGLAIDPVVDSTVLAVTPAWDELVRQLGFSFYETLTYPPRPCSLSAGIQAMQRSGLGIICYIYRSQLLAQVCEFEYSS
jgi:hypothetical protein